MPRQKATHKAYPQLTVEWEPIPCHFGQSLVRIWFPNAETQTITMKRFDELFNHPDSDSSH